MKIGILTLPLTYSYGGILQAVVLSRYLKNNGHDVYLIYKKTNIKFSKKIIKSILLHLPFCDIRKIKTINKIIEFHRHFINKEIPNISKNLYTRKDLENFVNKENLDAIIVGSDQVWRKQYIYDKYYKSYFLDFTDAKKVKKIAYAASFGKDYWEGKDDIEDISRLLQDFTAISTREKSGVDICRNTFGYKNTKHVLDPTMLMTKDFYINDIISHYDTSKAYKKGLLTFILDETKEKKIVIDFVSNSLGIKKINHLGGYNKNEVLFSIPEWLKSILNADFVITDSFHGMVFSIIFEKNFIVIGNSDRGMDRFLSLLKLLKLENRLILNSRELKQENLIKINFKEVRKKLEEERDFSKLFLNNELTNLNKMKDCN